MNIPTLHIITTLGNGGAESVLYRLCIQNPEQYEVICLTDSGKYGPLLSAAGVRVHTLDMPRGKVTLAGFLRLWKLIRQARPAVIQTWMYHADLLGGMIGRLAGNQAILWNIRHTDLVPDKSRRSTIMVAKICAHLSRWMPHKIICCAERATETHAAMGYDSSRMVVIGNGCDLSHFTPDVVGGKKIRDELGVPEDVPLLGYVARCHPLKDHNTLLAAFALIRRTWAGARLLLVGPGMTAENAELKAMIMQYSLGEAVLLAGPRTDIPAVMSALDLHVMSSVSEGFPNVLAEAMACGTPCVTTDVGDAALIVGDTGWVVPANTPSALAAAISSALVERNNSDAWNLRKRAARMRIEERFSLASMVSAYQAVWQTANANKPE
ncbi:glycosyltransferase family 4 protein [Nitrosomonas halophila]|uniref:Glycosyltransferase involved in cell wall bisynthesis n=1 Tax=Nitrosomonas halophila TaxID=44576 RepID=A0A1H3HW59_9PROT|nr:glycosyltransferase [Nitrosomonas halophila]SDY18994.1 Glycosyltransferase involved in cell wall bisynthesis [Nitrosomonas halophila]